ncbi:MAG: bifunctional phosphoribosylaminoimidazolecarboxamide formyltransferase/IMP cyclohydrolase [Candidatus Puniceispirillum sp.]|nr:bifunctional phosphoribosylaminoimidazolecarboxamide formyltransferase/IMP cyclohydrolase [Candidatus Puniceispirillum sp.]MBL6773842.1 bifunctional phosphoribosylaminoimidazolecarboxamide formyltransferase/IMP cyclohydrolase [Candidatus Puniceispirillum sp.]
MTSAASIPIRRALLSVSDKTGLIEFATRLTAAKIDLLSTGGTASLLRDAGLNVTDVAEVTGFPEIMGGRVKTLHPKIHGSLLARRDLDDHVAAMSAQGIECIDLLVVNLYPFEETLRQTSDRQALVEKIDIGGPAMLRAAAKNHDFLTVICDPADYASVADAIEKNGGTELELRRRLAAKTFARTAAYDSAISGWMASSLGEELPEITTTTGRKIIDLRYGENPHQQAALYKTGQDRPGVASAVQIQGKPLSYNNINDTDAAFELVAEFDQPTIAIIKHSNPCGVASGDNLGAAWRHALAADPVSAFGGIVAMNRPLDAETATAVASIFTEVLIAPEASDEARAIMAAKPNLRLLITDALPDPSSRAIKIKSVAGGFLAQSRDAGIIGVNDLKIVTKRAPTEAEISDMLFAWKVTKHVKSNAIVFVNNASTAGIGAGQMSRVDAARIAVHKAADIAAIHGWSDPRTIGSVVASDAFFPFADGLEALITAGATAVIQPGGSVKDNEVIAAADAAGIAMVFTGMRHFNH